MQLKALALILIISIALSAQVKTKDPYFDAGKSAGISRAGIDCSIKKAGGLVASISSNLKPASYPGAMSYNQGFNQGYSSVMATC